MATDRPDQTESSTLVPAGFVQVEIGVQTEQQNIVDNGVEERQTTLSYPDILVRYGLLPSWELRLVVGHQEYRYAGEAIRGFNPISIGSKIAVCDEQGLRPEIAMIGHLTLPSVGREEFRPSFIAPDFRFAASHTLSEVLSLGYNLGMEWDGESALATTIYTAALGVGIGEQAGAFVEVFGEFPEIGPSSHLVDGGFTYSPLPNLQFDAYAGAGLNEEAPDFLLGAGLSFRLPR